MNSRYLPGWFVGFALAAATLPGCGDQASSGGAGGTPNASGGAESKGGAPGTGGASGGGTGQTGNGGASNGGATASTSGGSSTAPSGGTASSGGANGGTSIGSGGVLTSSGGHSQNATGGKGGSSGGSGAGGSSAGGTNSSSGGTSNGGAGGASAGAAGNGTSNGPVKVWIAGDSTVQNCSSACPCGWGSQFDPLFNSNVTVQNSAVGGRSVQTWLYDANVSSTMTNGECALSSTAYNARWTAMTNASTGMKSGDYLFIQFGINDGDSTCPRHVGLTLFKDYLGKMAQAAKDHGAQPIFLTPVSAISCNSSGKAVGTRGAFVTATIDAGSTYGVPVIDLHQLSVDLYNSLGLCPNNSDYTTGKVGDFFCEDHTHFEAAGAKQIAQIIAKALRDQKIGLASYLL